MKVAILISGYLRSFKTNLPKIKENILDKFSNVDVYIHITKNECKDDIYLNLSNLDEDINLINKEINPLSIICEENYFFSEDKKINNVFNLWFKYYKLNELKKLNEESNGEKYDLVIKYRPDLNLFSPNIFDIDFSDDILYLPKESLVDKNKLTNIHDNYICDIFAFGNSCVMDKYFSIYERLSFLIEKNGPISETILFHHLNDQRVKIKQLDIDYNVILSTCNVFAICGDSGSGKTTLGNILKKYFSNSFMLECDRYHKWERNDENWNKFTHLNPESNFLTKMNEDIFDLKIGNTVYQVDYDHKTGKFTEKEIIDSSDNIIVCGLHSLYTTDENIYNLKIYIDTEEELKNFWKINRDTKQRGYSIEKSLEQIESRREDYEKFIKPQKEKSDLIINFYYDFSGNKNFDEEKISLRVFIKNKYNLNSLVEQFYKSNIDMLLRSNENFYILDFEKYTNSISLNQRNFPNLNNFYDYIMCIIIHLNESTH